MTGLNGENFINAHRRHTRHRKGTIINGLFHFKLASPFDKDHIESYVADVPERYKGRLEENKEIKGNGYLNIETLRALQLYTSNCHFPTVLKNSIEFFNSSRKFCFCFFDVFKGEVVII